MTRAAIIAAEALWNGGHPPDHPLRPERLQYTWEMLQAYQALNAPNVRVASPRPVSDDELATFHSRDYIETVRQLSQGLPSRQHPAAYNFGPGDNPIFKGMFESESLKVGAALVGAELLLNNEVEVAFSFTGGLHHAGPHFAYGFCVFGDGVIAIQRMLAAGWRVAYIDIDAHHGDGVQDAFYADPRVLTISFHESGRYLFPGTGFADELGEGEGYGYSVNVPLMPYTDDDTFLWAFDQVVPPLVARFKPDVIVAELGVDTHWSDPLTHLALTSHGHEALFRRIHNLSPRWLALGGGGYEVTVVPRAYTLAWGVMSNQTFSNELPKAVTNRYNSPYLHDTKPAPLTAPQRNLARMAAEEVVQELQQALKLT